MKTYHFSTSVYSLYPLLFLSQLADHAACQDGKALEKRESECGYHQLWRRGEELLVYPPFSLLQSM